MTYLEKRILDDLLESELGLLTWEMDFLENLNNERIQKLTKKQSDKLRQIWDRIFD